MFVVNPFEVILGVENASVCSVFVSEVNLAVGVAVEVEEKSAQARHRADSAPANSRRPGVGESQSCPGLRLHRRRAPGATNPAFVRELDGPYFAQSAPLSHLTKADR